LRYSIYIERHANTVVSLKKYIGPSNSVLVRDKRKMLIRSLLVVLSCLLLLSVITGEDVTCNAGEGITSVSESEPCRNDLSYEECKRYSKMLQGYDNV
jgi:hypothetical protein